MIPDFHAIDIEIGQRVARRRKQLGRNQTDLANAIGKTFQQIQKYEKGDNRISASVLVVMANYLGSRPGDFLPDLDGAPLNDGRRTPPVTRDAVELLERFDHLDASARFALLIMVRALDRQTDEVRPRAA